jgi:protein ImuA
MISLGSAVIDNVIGGGLARGALHELLSADVADAASVAGFAAMLARRAGEHVVWLREEAAARQGGHLYGGGLLETALPPQGLLLGLMPDQTMLLKAAVDVVRCPEAGIAIIELWGHAPLYDLTASRRLLLAAERSGVTAVVLRVAATPVPSAAETRWRVAPAPSVPLPGKAPGYPRMKIELLRQRRRPGGQVWLVEWNHDQSAFRLCGQGEGGARAALSDTVVSFPVHRQAAGEVPLARHR